MDDVDLAKFVFQSTLPARGATFESFKKRDEETFQSTLPARGATPPQSLDGLCFDISIHAPREGSDRTYDHLGQCL